MKLTKSRLKQIIKEELALDEAGLAPAIYQKLKAAGKLPAGAKIDFKQGQGKQAAPEAQAQQQPKAKGPVNKIAIIQALAPKVGKQAAQLIISKLDDQALTTLGMMLAKTA